MRRILIFAIVAGLAGLPAAPEAAENTQTPRCGERDRAGYQWIFDGSRKCFRRWRHAGGARIGLRSGTLRTQPGGSNLGLLWYAARRYRDFSLRLQFRDDSPVGGPRANSGVHVRFPAPRPPVPGCPMTSNGVPQTGAPEAWIAINCGHEVQINDSPEVPGNDPRKTGSIYGFADVDLARARPRRRRRLERPRDPRRRTALHGDPQRRGHQPVREPAGRAGARPATRSGLQLARPRGLHRTAESWRAAGRRVVPPHQAAAGLTRARRGADTRCDDAARRARGERSARLARSAGRPAAERNGGAGRNRARPPAAVREPCRRPDARGAPRTATRAAAGAAAVQRRARSASTSTTPGWRR